MEALDQPPEGVVIVHRAPSRGNGVVEAVQPKPVVLEVEAFACSRHGGAIKQQRAVIRHDLSEAPEMAFAVRIFPVRRAKDAVKVH